MKPLMGLTGLADCWPADWIRAVARAQSVYAIPSAYPMVSRSVRLVEPLTEGRRKRERFEV